MVLVAVTPDDCEFYTPQYILEKVYRCFPVDIDPCSPVNNPVVKANVHYTKEENGLNKPWIGNIFLNPPYGRFIIEWVKKFLSEWNAGNIHNAILLIPMKCDTKWFNLLAEQCSIMCTVKGRLQFTNPTGKAKHGTFGSCLMLFSRGGTQM